MAEPIDPDFLRILVCPLSKAPLIQRGDWLYSTDSATRKRYPIRDGIPIMLIEEAEEVDAEEFQRTVKGPEGGHGQEEAAGSPRQAPLQ